MKEILSTENNDQKENVRRKRFTKKIKKRYKNKKFYFINMVIY